MLPAPKSTGPRLADVLASSLASVRGEENPLGLPGSGSAVVVLADGLGAAVLKARAGHARTLVARSSARSTIDAGFPTTTAAALATLATGARPGEHGLVGYTVLDAANDRVVNQLSGWDDRLDPATWQRVDTVFERAGRLGVRSVAIGQERYRTSGFTAAILRGAEYIAGASIDDRVERAIEVIRAGGPTIVYLYVSELDVAAHANGWESPQWTEALEELDSGVRRLESALSSSDGLLVTADHGMLDVAPENHVLFDRDPALVDGVRFVAGDPRCIQLHVEPDASAAVRDRLVERWRAEESGRSWIVTRAEAIAADWFGPVAPEVEPRIGDVLVAARKSIAYYDSRVASNQSRAMIGQHGSFSAEERIIPLLRFGAFAR